MPHATQYKPISKKLRYIQPLPNKQVLLITGVANYWGGRVAARMVKEPGFRVIGLDARPPKVKVEGLDFVQSDVRNPALVDLLRLEKVDIVCHLAFNEHRQKSEADFDLNVMGAMKVFGACAEAQVRKIVFKSSTKVYGAQADNPAFLPESWPLRGRSNYGYIRYRVEIESFASGFAKQFPEIMVTSLRVANVLGPTHNGPFCRLLRGRVVPRLLGFNPVMQMIHEDDVVEALTHAISHDRPGAFNIAAADLMPLVKALRLANCVDVPVVHPLAYWSMGILNGTPLKTAQYFPLDVDYLRYRWVGDLRKMQEQFGWLPRHTAAETLAEFAANKGRTVEDHEELAQSELFLLEALQQRRQAKMEAGLAERK